MLGVIVAVGIRSDVAVASGTLVIVGKAIVGTCVFKGVTVIRIAVGVGTGVGVG